MSRLRCLLLLVLVAGCADPEENGDSPGGIEETATAGPTWVGSESCQGCHATEYEAWQQSHHFAAMRPATSETILADFSRPTGADATFSQADGSQRVEIEDGSGTRQTFDITHTFGVSPLQQYLVAMPNGSKQALTIAWDSRNSGEGGQRWFNLQSGPDAEPGGLFHWTSPPYRWNSACAACHSTALTRGYNAEEGTYDTQYAEVNIGCEACHGPASEHIAWTRNPVGINKGFDGHLAGYRPLEWAFEAGDPIANPSGQPETAILDTCSPCHARRSALTETDLHTRTLHDTHDVAVLEQGLYHPDGQILDEVFVHGSFVQSSMHAAGVTCTNCHNPHDAGATNPDAGTCLGCHAAATYAVAEHHHHPGQADVDCISCHMGTQTYMGVDVRHDHSFRIPRPDLTAELGVPNTCNACHTDQTPDWAAGQIADWTGEPPPPHFARVFAAADAHDYRARQQLMSLIELGEVSPIVRASALSRLTPWFDERAVNLVRVQLRDPDAMVRREAVRLVGLLPPERRDRLLTPLLDDPAMAVRVAATRAMAGSGSSSPLFGAAADALEARYKTFLDEAPVMAEYAGWLIANGDYDRARTLLEAAVSADPNYVPAIINLADYHRGDGDERAVMRVLQAGMAQVGDSAELAHAMALSHVRVGEYEEAVRFLESAVRSDPDSPRHALVLAIAQHSTGRIGAAIGTLNEAMRRAPWHHDIILTLAMFHRDAGNLSAALALTNRLDATSPRTQALVADLRNRVLIERSRD